MNKPNLLVLLISVFLFFLVAGSGLLYNFHTKNIKICEIYWDDTCYSYNTQQDICLCERGDYKTTSEMIEQRNDIINEQAFSINQQYIEERQLTIEEGLEAFKKAGLSKAK